MLDSILSIFKLLGSMFMKFTVMFSTMKSVLVSLLLVSLPPILFNFAGRWFQHLNVKAMDYANNHLPSNLQNLSYEFTGFAGYLCHHLRLVECSSIVFTAIVTAFIFRCIPFLRWFT